MPQTIRPGDVLAGRYRLVDLLVDSAGARFWRAHDRVLERHVALHVIRADDERAAGLLAAARRSATVHDPHLLRVLDAETIDGGGSGGLCYVVNEWADGASLDMLLGASGPLGPRRAAYVVAEVAEAVDAGHRQQVPHGRLCPENVLVDRSGSVRLIGFAVDAALHGLGPGTSERDLVDLVGLLYCALTGRWAGVSASALPGAPQEHGRVLRPRQVRAGVPRILDDMCVAVLDPGAARRVRDLPEVRSAWDLTVLLREFVGDTTGMPEALLRGLPAVPRAQPARPAESDSTDATDSGLTDPGLPDTGLTDAGLPDPGLPDPGPADPDPADPDPADPDAPPGRPVAAALPEPTLADEAAASPAPAPRPTSADEQTTVATPTPERVGAPGADATVSTDIPAPGPPTPVTELPTQAGMPIFDDERDEVSWLRARTEQAPPPPPLAEPPERPLFAPDPPEGARSRRSPLPESEPGSYWPWDTGARGGAAIVPSAEEDATEVPGRRSLLLGLGVGLALLVLVVAVVLFNVGRGRTPLGQQPGSGDDTSPSVAPTATATPLSGLSADDFDPQGDPNEENPDQAPLAVDGDRSTAWSTVTYVQQLGPTGLKTGVGLLVDLGGSYEVDQVVLRFLGAPTAASIFVTDTAPLDLRGMSPVASGRAAGETLRLRPAQPPQGRYLVVWLTELPPVDGGYRGAVAEVEVRGE